MPLSFLFFRRRRKQQQDFLEAVRGDEIPRIRSMLLDKRQAGTSVGRGGRGASSVLVTERALRLASLHGQVDALRLMLPYWKGQKGEFLAHATRRNHLEAVKVLLEAGADVNEAIASTGVTALHMAAAAHHPTTSTGDNNSDNDNDNNNNNNNGGCLEFLLNAGAAVNATNINGETPLFLATRTLRLAAVQRLLQADANIHHTNRQGLSVLLVAVDMPNVSLKLVQLLLSHGADVNAVDKQGETVLYKALLAWLCSSSSSSFSSLSSSKMPTTEEQNAVHLLLQHGARISEEVLALAIEQDSFEMVQLLLQCHHAPVTDTVLAFAIQSQRVALLDRLLLPAVTIAQRMNKKTRTSNNNAAARLHWALPYPAVLCVVLKHHQHHNSDSSSSSNSNNNNTGNHSSVDDLYLGESALQVAVRCQHLQSVQVLLDHGANPCWGPLEVACRGGGGGGDDDDDDDTDRLSILYALVSSRPEMVVS